MKPPQALTSSKSQEWRTPKSRMGGDTMNAKAKGTRNEYKTIKLLNALGYTCTRSAASKGLWDVVAYHQTHVRLVQVKSNNPIKAEERSRLELARVPLLTSKEIWSWKDGAKYPEVEVLP